MTTNRLKSIAVLLSAAALASCSYEKNAIQDIVGPVPDAGVRFFNFGVLAPQVNFYADDTKITAVTVGTCTFLPSATPTEACLTTGAESVNGVSSGNVGSGGLYSGLDPGAYTFTGRISTTVDKNLSIANLTHTLEDGKRYSFYQSGTYNTTTKTIDAFIVEDPVPAQDWTTAYVRFVHAVSTAAPMTLYARNRTTGVETAIGGTTAYKSAGTFTNLPGPSALYDLSTRYDGAATNVMVRTGVSFLPGTAYSITARGDLTVLNDTACPATSRSCLDNTTHR